MSQRYSAGADWSGKPIKIGDSFIFCVVALGDAEAWDRACVEIRERLKMPQRREFHGHEMKDDSQRLELLKAGQDAGMRVGAFISIVEDIATPLTPEGVALGLLEQFLPTCPLQNLWFDKGDVKGKNAEQAFATEVCRVNRAIYPASSLEANCRKSSSSSLIQLADVMAYAFRTQERGKLKNPQLKALLKEIERDQRNLIIRG